MSHPQAPAGWYPQPDGTQRYWDGQHWTDHFAPAQPQTQVEATQVFASPSQAYSPDFPPQPLTPEELGEEAGSRPWFKKKRFVIPGAVVVLFLALGVASISQEGDGSQGDSGTTSSQTHSPKPQASTKAKTDTSADPTPELSPEEPTTSPSPSPTKSSPEPSPKEPTSTPEPEASQEDDGLSTSQTQAIRSAESYLKTMPFSREGLIEQLEFEGFSASDATQAVDAVDPDWSEQAVRSAESYLATMAFSKQGLVEQLEFEGYTTDQATHGASKVDADWMEQAARSAEDYLEYMPFSRDSLIDQLLYEGFSEEQAIHGVDSVGL